MGLYDAGQEYLTWIEGPKSPRAWVWALSSNKGFSPCYILLISEVSVKCPKMPHLIFALLERRGRAEIPP